MFSGTVKVYKWNLLPNAVNVLFIISYVSVIEKVVSPTSSNKYEVNNNN